MRNWRNLIFVRTWSGLILFLTFKIGLMYLMRAWIKKALNDMEKQKVSQKKHSL